MYWHRMGIDEFAMFNRKNGMNVLELDNVWWAEVRPFFFRPLYPLAEVDPQLCRYPLKSAVGGILHAVSRDAVANAHFNAFVYDDIQNYSDSLFGKKWRHNVRKGLHNFRIKPVTDRQEFIDCAYDIYLSFSERAQYWYKMERKELKHFAAWADILFGSGKVAVLGVYRNGKLSAVEVSCQVEDIIWCDTFFADTQSLKGNVTDFVVHSIREAAVATDAKYVFIGFPSGKQSLDESKMRGGCKILRMPAYCRINPLAMFVVNHFMKESYRKFAALTSPSPLGATPCRPLKSVSVTRGWFLAVAALAESPECDVCGTLAGYALF